MYLNPMCAIEHRLKSKFAFQIVIYYCYIDITSHFEVFFTNSMHSSQLSVVRLTERCLTINRLKNGRN